MAWYIDSWSVFDGLAFASQRPADSIDADATVFLSVPDLEPVPMGRMSTALRAQRASFQDGFRDAEGNEIPFDSLDQIREVVRRAYLGGGLGPAPVAIDAPPIDPLLREPKRPPTEPPPRNGGGFLEMELERLAPSPMCSSTMLHCRIRPLGGYFSRPVPGRSGSAGSTFRNDADSWNAVAVVLLDDTRIWIITEADRSVTTVLLPEEY